MNKKLLYCSILAVLAVPFGAQGEEMGPLDTVYVQAQRDVRDGGYFHTTSRLGVIGNRSVLEIPFTQVSMTEKAVHDFATPSLPLQKVLMNQPAVQESSSSPMYTDFSVRGIGMNGTHVYFNNVPSLFSQFRMPPTHMIGRIDLMVGPASALNGTAASSNGTNGGKSAAPGVMNVLSKQAGEEPLRTVTLNYTSKKNVGAFFDVGDRFGKKKNTGVRIYAGLVGGQLELSDSGKNEKTVGVNVDHQSDSSRTNLFAGHIDLRVDGSQRWFKTNAKTLISAPDHHMDYDFPETTKYAHWNVFTINHEQDLSENWVAFFNAGSSTWSGYKYNMNAALEFDEKGNFFTTEKNKTGDPLFINKSNLMNEKAKNTYYQVGLRGNVQTGAVQHTVTLSYDQANMTYWKINKGGGKNLVGGNLYDGIVFKDGFYPLPIDSTRPWSYDEKNTSLTVNDLMTFDKWNVLVGVTKRKGHLLSTSETVDTNNTLPTFGITYRLADNISIYGGHSQSFSRGTMVADKYKNKGEILDPVRQKQTEFGVKYDGGDWLATAAYFNIDQGGYIEMQKDDGLYFVRDGMNEYKGVELTFNGKISERVTAQGGLMYLDAKRTATTKGAKDGWFVPGVSKHTAVLALTYDVNDSFSLLGRMKYSSSAYVNDNKAELPGYTTFDFGMNWKTTIADRPVDVHAMIYNVFDKSAWMGRAGSTTFGLTWPRTYTLSATIGF